MKINHRFSVLPAVLVALLAIGCADASDPQTGAATEGGETTAAETSSVTEDASYGRSGTRDNLPDTLDFGGETVRVLSRSADYDTRIEFLAQDSSGDVVEDAVYRRNLQVMERLNLTMEVIEVNETRHESSGVNHRNRQ